MREVYIEPTPKATQLASCYAIRTWGMSRHKRRIFVTGLAHVIHMRKKQIKKYSVQNDR